MKAVKEMKEEEKEEEKDLGRILDGKQIRRQWIHLCNYMLVEMLQVGLVIPGSDRCVCGLIDPGVDGLYAGSR